MSAGIYDDASSLFDYKDNAWIAGGETQEFDGTSHSSDVSGAEMVFGPFIGSSIQVFSTVGTNQTKLHFSVDGNGDTDLPAETNNQVQFQQQVYSTGGLSPTAQHSLVINLLNAGPFTVDYVVVGGQTATASVSTQTATTTSSATTTPLATNGASLLAAVPQSSGSSSTTQDSSSPTLATSTPGISPGSSVPNSDIFTTTFTSGSVIVTTTQAISSPLPATASPTSSPSASAIAATSSHSGLDAIVIGSVTGAILIFAIAVVAAVLYLRRRRLRRTEGPLYNNRPGSRNTPSKYRRSLRVEIPGTLPDVQRFSSLLPLHNSNNHSSTTVTPLVKASSPRSLHTPAEDPAAESPVFDIKQRPASGSTMTTRVTVGTSIGQRASISDSPYKIAYPDEPAPPMPAIPPLAKAYETAHDEKRRFGDALDGQPSPAETGSSSAISKNGTLLTGFGDYGSAGAMGIGTNDTSVYPSPLERVTSVPPGMTASRPLPYIPTDANPPAPGRRALPMAPHLFDPEAYAVVHEDAGVRLTLTGMNLPQTELPPPYRDYGT